MKRITEKDKYIFNLEQHKTSIPNFKNTIYFCIYQKYLEQKLTLTQLA